jgi:hypothetical protein
MQQRLVIVGKGRTVTSLPRDVQTLPWRLHESAGVDPPTPDNPVRVPLARMEYTTGADGSVEWNLAEGKETRAWLEFLA